MLMLVLLLPLINRLLLLLLLLLMLLILNYDKSIDADTAGSLMPSLVISSLPSAKRKEEAFRFS